MVRSPEDVIKELLQRKEYAEQIIIVVRSKKEGEPEKMELSWSTMPMPVLTYMVMFLYERMMFQIGTYFRPPVKDEKTTDE